MARRRTTKRTKTTKKRRPKKFIQKGIKRPGALTAYAKRTGGVGKDGRIKRAWAQALQRRLRAKKNKTAADTRRLRQVNMYLGVLSRGRKRR